MAPPHLVPCSKPQHDNAFLPQIHRPSYYFCSSIPDFWVTKPLSRLQLKVYGLATASVC